MPGLSMPVCCSCLVVLLQSKLSSVEDSLKAELHTLEQVTVGQDGTCGLGSNKTHQHACHNKWSMLPPCD